VVLNVFLLYCGFSESAMNLIEVNSKVEHGSLLRTRRNT